MGCIALSSCVKQITELQLSNDVVLISKIEAQYQLQALKSELRFANQKYDEVKNLETQAQNNFTEAKNEARDLKNAAQQVVDLTDELKQIFADFPEDLAELEEEIREGKAKADANLRTNPKIIQDYNKRKLEIEELSLKLQNQQIGKEKLAEKIEKTKRGWLSPLKTLIVAINNSFSSYFNEIGCAGEVVLAQHENDFEKYGIEIRVKYRNEDKLQALDAHVQSGGERSVATMLYLISLQDITPCPFRLVDEINQGMDPDNERMIFHQVTKMACKADVPQYFLITPKLLPDLTFTPEMKILCIFNGPWVLPQQEWNTITI